MTSWSIANIVCLLDLRRYVYCIIWILWHHNSQLIQYGSCWWLVACLVLGWCISGVLTYAENGTWLLNIKTLITMAIPKNSMLKCQCLISLFFTIFPHNLNSMDVLLWFVSWWLRIMMKNHKWTRPLVRNDLLMMAHLAWQEYIDYVVKTLHCRTINHFRKYHCMSM